MPLRVYCGKPEKDFKPVILLERYIRSLKDSLYDDRTRRIKGAYRMFRIESAIDINMGVSKNKSDDRNGWSLRLDDIDAVFNWTLGHEGVAFKLSGDNLPLFLWFSRVS